MECIKVKESIKKLFISSLSQSTWSGFRPHFACLEAAGRSSLRKLRRQEVKSDSPAREARLMTPHLARPNSNPAFASAEAVAMAV